MTEQGTKIPDNPFHTQGMIKDHSLFFGRKTEMERIWGHLRKGENVSIVAPRRLGKSSILWQITQKAKELVSQDVEVFYFDMQLVFTMDEFFEILYKKLRIDNGNRSIPELQDALENKQVVLCLDEFDRTANNENFSDDFFSILRGLAQGRNLSLVIASKIPLTEYSKEGMTSPFYNIFNPDPILLGALELDEARELLSGIAALRGLDFKPDDVRKALDTVKIYNPWNIQFFGSCWVNAGMNIEKAVELYNSQLPANGKQEHRSSGESIPDEHLRTVPIDKNEKTANWLALIDAILAAVFFIVMVISIQMPDIRWLLWVMVGILSVIIGFSVWLLYILKGKEIWVRRIQHQHTAL